MAPIIETRGLVKRYDQELAVAGVDLVVETGEIYGLVGPNGAGKTTIMRILATLLAPTAGNVLVCGIDAMGSPVEVRRRIGYLDFFARCYGVPAARRATMVSELLEIVGLTDKRNAYVEALSRGMRQRLCLAHTLVHDPQLLILDEPASGLDPRARVEVREILRTLRDMGKTILVSSHILPELGELCTSVGIIDHGRLLRSGRIEDIERSLRAAAMLRIDLLSDAEAAMAWLGTDHRVDSVLQGERSDGVTRLELAFDGGADAQADLLRRMVEAGHAVASFSQATSGLEEIFLQVTGKQEESAA